MNGEEGGGGGGGLEAKLGRCVSPEFITSARKYIDGTSLPYNNTLEAPTPGHTAWEWYAHTRADVCPRVEPHTGTWVRALARPCPLGTHVYMSAASVTVTVRGER